MKTILVPTDFSDNAQTALQYAAVIASHLRAKIILFFNAHQVVNLESIPNWQNQDEEWMALYEGKLKKIADQIRLEHGFRFEVSIACRKGNLIPNMNQLVIEKAVDLVVMGTKGASSWLDKFIGTNTSAFIETSPCPVLIVPPKTEPVLPRHIAYAADFENEEETFLKQLLAIAGPLFAAITVVNVESESQLNTVIDDQIINEIQKDFPGNTLAFAQLRENDIAAGLEAFVEDNNLQVLALAMRSRNYFETLFHHSLTRELVFHARVPLLILPVPKKARRKTSVDHQEADILY